MSGRLREDAELLDQVAKLVNLARRERTTSPVAAKRIIEARDAEWAASTPGSGSR